MLIEIIYIVLFNLFKGMEQLTRFTAQQKIFGAFLPMVQTSMLRVVAPVEVQWQSPQAFVTGKSYFLPLIRITSS